MFDKEFKTGRDKIREELMTKVFEAILQDEIRKERYELGDLRYATDTQGRPLLAVNRIAELQKKFSLTPGEEIELKMLLERKW